MTDRTAPDASGRFGDFGGRYAPETLMGALAEFERSLIVERTRAGLDAAKARGARLGRPTALTDEQIEDARTLIASGKSVTAVARSLNVGRSTLYRALIAAEAA